MTNRTFLVFIAVVSLLGVGIGYSLSCYPKLETNKVLNVVGLFYDALGIVVLSEIVSTSQRLRNLILNIVAPGILWINTCLPLGVLIGGIVALKFPSSAIIIRSSVTFWVWSLIPMTLFEGFVVFPKFRLFQSTEVRWRCFGIFILLSGVVIQLIAAIMDLRS